MCCYYVYELIDTLTDPEYRRDAIKNLLSSMIEGSTVTSVRYSSDTVIYSVMYAIPQDMGY